MLKKKIESIVLNQMHFLRIRFRNTAAGRLSSFIFVIYSNAFTHAESVSPANT